MAWTTAARIILITPPPSPSSLSSLSVSHSFPSFHPRFSPIFLTALSKAYPFERLSNGSLKNLEFQNQRAPPVVRIVEWDNSVRFMEDERCSSVVRQC